MTAEPLSTEDEALEVAELTRINRMNKKPDFIAQAVATAKANLIADKVLEKAGMFDELLTALDRAGLLLALEGERVESKAIAAIVRKARALW